MKSIVFKFTIIALVTTIVWTMAEHTLGYNTTKHNIGQYTRVVTAFAFYAIVVLSVWYRRKQQHGIITFAEGFKTGASVAVLYSGVIAIWFALYAEVINTQYRPTLLAFERSKLEAAHASAEVIAVKMKEVEMSSGGSFLSYVLLFVFMALFGIAAAAIGALSLRRKARVQQTGVEERM